MSGEQHKWTPPVHEGELAVSFKFEDGRLLKLTSQANRSEVLKGVQQERRDAPAGKRFLGGWKVASIPTVDVPRVKAKYPEIFTPGVDQETKVKALVRFSQDREFAHLIVRRA